MTDHIEDRILALAEKATPGPWNCLFGQVRSSATNHSDEHLIAVLDVLAPIAETNANGDYLASCSPEVVAAMCRVVAAGRKVAAGEKWGFAIGPAPIEAYQELDAALAALDEMGRNA